MKLARISAVLPPQDLASSYLIQWGVILATWFACELHVLGPRSREQVPSSISTDDQLSIHYREAGWREALAEAAHPDFLTLLTVTPGMFSATGTPSSSLNDLLHQTRGPTLLLPCFDSAPRNAALTVGLQVGSAPEIVLVVQDRRGGHVVEYADEWGIDHEPDPRLLHPDPHTYQLGFDPARVLAESDLGRGAILACGYRPGDSWLFLYLDHLGQNSVESLPPVWLIRY